MSEEKGLLASVQASLQAIEAEKNKLRGLKTDLENALNEVKAALGETGKDDDAGGGGAVEITPSILSAVVGKLTKDPQTIGELATATGLNSKTISKACAKLMEDGKAKKKGKAKGTRYYLA